ncbi:hypothetical protein CPB86DRAFT_779121 [Serendipita vermifera]|nr:hypothetical protein CPB86DRAFT_779121 [Serendipita vermifera]
MKNFSEMDLSLVGVKSFDVEGLYCLNDSPLQNQELFPGCYGICANPDVSGIGNRISLYIQTILTLWLATLTPNTEDTLGAMLAAIAASFTVFAATLTSYAYNNITFHHTLITINLSNLPTMAFFAGILRLRLQPGIIPLGPKLFATPILIIQLIACGVSVFLGVGLNSAVGSGAISSGRGGSGGWTVSQPQCSPETQVIIFGRSLQFWKTEAVSNLSNISPAERILILTLYGIIIFLPFLSSFICLYLPETGTLRAFATAFHQERRTNKFALFAFFVLSNAWTGLLIYVTEVQIMKNNVLPGENVWGSGQILAIMLCGIPLLGCLKILFTEVGNRHHPSRKWIKRSKLHRLFGIRFEGDTRTPTASAPGTPRPGTPRRPLSRNTSYKGEGGEEKDDIETGIPKLSPTMSSPLPNSPRSPRSPPPSATSPRSDSTMYESRRLSKRYRYQSERPEDIIVVPGEDSGPEDAPGSPRRRPPLADTRQSTLVNPVWKENDKKQKHKSSSGASIAGHSVRSTTGSVKVVVYPDGRMSRVLSRRNSTASGVGKDDVTDREERERPKPTRRLSKTRPESSLSASRRSKSEDGFYSANEDVEAGRKSVKSSRHASAAASPTGMEHDRETIRRGYSYAYGSDQVQAAGRQSEDSNKNDDPLSKYYWDPQRGWLERK